MPNFNITLGRNIFKPLADCENFSQLTLVQAPDISSSAEPCTPPSVSQNSTCGSNKVSLSPPALTEPSSVNPTSPGSDIVSPSLPPRDHHSLCRSPSKLATEVSSAPVVIGEKRAARSFRYVVLHFPPILNLCCSSLTR